jgi:hypothetical protein
VRPRSRPIRARPALAAALLTGCIRPEYPPPSGPMPLEAETYAHVRHIAVYEPPRLQTDPAPIWPGPPAQVQTSLEMLHQSPQAHAKPTAATMQRRGYGLCHPTADQPKPPGIKLGICYSKITK